MWSDHNESNKCARTTRIFAANTAKELQYNGFNFPRNEQAYVLNIVQGQSSK